MYNDDSRKAILVCSTYIMRDSSLTVLRLRESWNKENAFSPEISIYDIQLLCLNLS